MACILSVIILLQTVDSAGVLTNEEATGVQTPNSNENCSFDSALQMSEEFYVTSSQGWKETESDVANSMKGLSDLPASNMLKPSSSLSQASLSSGSNSEKNGGEHGFSCDSPEGGTIRKKPSQQAPTSALKQTNAAACSPNKQPGIISGIHW